MRRPPKGNFRVPILPRVRAPQVTKKSDVYSFGVVLLELLTGRRAQRAFPNGTRQNLTDQVRTSRTRSVGGRSTSVRRLLESGMSRPGVKNACGCFPVPRLPEKGVRLRPDPSGLPVATAVGRQASWTFLISKAGRVNDLLTFAVRSKVGVRTLDKSTPKGYCGSIRRRASEGRHALQARIDPGGLKLHGLFRLVGCIIFWRRSRVCGTCA